MGTFLSGFLAPNDDDIAQEVHGRLGEKRASIRRHDVELQIAALYGLSRGRVDDEPSLYPRLRRRDRRKLGRFPNEVTSFLPLLR